MAKTKKSNRGWTKRHLVAEGDFVRIHSPMPNMTGSFVRVVGQLSKNEILVQAYPLDHDFHPMKFTVDPREWDVANWSGNGGNPYYKAFIEGVLIRATPKPRKAKAARTVHVLRTHDEIQAVLRGETSVSDNAHVVVALEEGIARVEAAQAETAQPPTGSTG